MSSMNPPGSLYSPTHPYDSSYKYEEPLDPQIPRGYPEQFGHLPQSVPQHPGPPPRRESQISQGGQSRSGDPGPKQRLRKACDSCSVRKVKCDESGPPCKSCAALDIPCTFERPSRRRGPPNRHAEAIKRQKLENGASAQQPNDSPTHDAAYSLAALSLPATLSAESICDLQSIEVLIDDYFLYIHPLIPLPHEPTFRAAFANRQDKTDRSFLSLIASMLETLVASFPRRARRLFTSEQSIAQFPNAGALIDRCHQVFVEARGLGYLDRPATLYDAVSSYLAGLASAYVYDIRRMRLYFGECVMMLRTLGIHRPDIHAPVGSAAGADAAAERRTPANYVYQESSRRLFWLMFVSAMSGRQLDDPEADILMPPIAYVELLPPLPQEVDDEYITEEAIYQQPPDQVSEMVGFNLNAKVFRAFHTLAALETAFGTDTVYDWERQKQVIKRALVNVKAATADAPKELQLQPINEFGEWPPISYEASAYSIQDPNLGPGSLAYPSSRRGSLVLPFPKQSVQYEIQKANIYATQLATRSYLVERYWNLVELHERNQTTPHSGERVQSVSSQSSPTGGDTKFISNLGRSPSDTTMDASEQSMAVEREDIIRNLALLLRSINQVNMEPNGLSFCNKIRQIASTLLETKRARMSVMPTLDSESVNNYLYQFLEILAKLNRLGPSRLRPDEASTEYGAVKTAEEIEDEELVHWASLKEHQERFVRSEEILIGA
ncbi:uncharacterized protein HMPREF1541_01554 [Cyphellophora europaea CBS 101466]|uniref:Zn(2)-C6 fungal-type domain-containing protein n=1 Tax=Cyphellophora europaea (strain CBS 101466) TaxID=1220924 RepID=W2S1F3_CYPE1|nr:uncharacterized protein HMPREF1541_01554 [Cyphellophora europaea CBS 101466]ETN42400.1 hypothetical protein HMPREF1541_01554 [Cyphellophora europaea CBS 101466]